MDILSIFDIFVFFKLKTSVLKILALDIFDIFAFFRGETRLLETDLVSTLSILLGKSNFRTSWTCSRSVLRSVSVFKYFNNKLSSCNVCFYVFWEFLEAAIAIL